MHSKADVILITGHPATGKTTLAKRLSADLHLSLLCKDAIKETLFDSLGYSDRAWSERLGPPTWEVMYLQIESLLKAGVSHVAEANFDPRFANPKWQRYTTQFPINLIQVRCHAKPHVILERYRQRIADGSRHPGHVDRLFDDRQFLAGVQTPLGWVDVPSQHIDLDTTQFGDVAYHQLLAKIHEKQLC